jgi:hypothetical protein
MLQETRERQGVLIKKLPISPQGLPGITLAGMKVLKTIRLRGGDMTAGHA